MKFSGEKSDRSTIEQSVQKRTQSGSRVASISFSGRKRILTAGGAGPCFRRSRANYAGKDVLQTLGTNHHRRESLVVESAGMNNQNLEQLLAVSRPTRAIL